MYIKKSRLVLIITAIVLVTAFLTIVIVNPFGFSNIGEFMKLSYVSKAINDLYYEDVDSKEAAEMAIAGVAASVGDPYTGYLWGDMAKDYLENMEGNYCGIGLYIEMDMEENLISVVSPIAGSPAEAAGITTGDKILKIDGEPYTGEQLNEASSYLKGEEGTDVVVTFRIAATGEEKDITLKRSRITIQNVTGKMLDNNIGYIKISQFAEDVGRAFAKQCAELGNSGMQSLIIDLRNNPGGLLDQAIEAASVFVPDGEIVTYTLDKHGKKEEYTAKLLPETDKIDVPVVILTNNGSASASEVFTGALKDYNLATIIGEKSYGKGVVQSVFMVGDGLVTVTVSRYYTPDGVCIHGEGIEPDMTVEMDAEKAARLTNLDMADDNQLLAAIDFLSRE